LVTNEVGIVKVNAGGGLRQPMSSEAESKEKHGVWDPMPELTKTLLYVHSRVDYNTFTMGNPMTESTLSPRGSQFFRGVIGFGLRCAHGAQINLWRSNSIFNLCSNSTIVLFSIW